MGRCKNCSAPKPAAVLLQLHVKPIHVLARSGRLPGIRVGREWLFDQQQLKAVRRGIPPRLAKADVEISPRNQLRGRVTAIALGGGMAEARLQIDSFELVSVITRASFERLGIRVGG